MTIYISKIQKKLYLLIATMVILSAGIMAEKIISNQVDIRGRAGAPTAQLSILPTSLVSTDSNATVQVWLTTDYPVVFARVDVTFDSSVVQLNQEISLTDSGLTRVVDLSTMAEANGNGGKISIVLALDPANKSNPPSGAKQLAILHFRSKTASMVTTTVKVAASSQIVSPEANVFFNQLASADITFNSLSGPTLTPTKIPTATPTMKPGVSPTLTPTKIPTATPTMKPGATYLKFDMTFLGITAGAQCAAPLNMPLKVTVMAADGATKTFTDVIATKLVGSQGGLGIYQVKLGLNDFGYRDNLAIFVRDDRHPQIKYGVNGQKEYYNKKGGEIGGLTDNEITTPMFDFTEYPLFAGDVTGPNGIADGVVDGMDFSYIKTKAIEREEVAPGGYVLADLNGNCKMESQDLAILMLSLREKQGQLY